MGATNLHLGSGSEPKEGWIHVDLAGDPTGQVVELGQGGVPFPDESVDAIFHEHLLEHIALRAGAQLMGERDRVLKRVGSCAAAARMLAVQELSYGHRHTTMSDDQTLALMFRAAGFPTPAVRKFGDTDLGAALDTERRRTEALYMEGRKPGR